MSHHAKGRQGCGGSRQANRRSWRDGRWSIFRYTGKAQYLCGVVLMKVRALQTTRLISSAGVATAKPQVSTEKGAQNQSRTGNPRVFCIKSPGGRSEMPGDNRTWRERVTVQLWERPGSWLTNILRLPSSALVTGVGAMTVSEKLALASLLLGIVSAVRLAIHRRRVEAGQPAPRAIL